MRVSAVAALWRLPDGSTRTGEVSAIHGAKAGSAVRVCLEDKGFTARPPACPVSATVGAAVIASTLWEAPTGLVAAL